MSTLPRPPRDLRLIVFLPADNCVEAVRRGRDRPHPSADDPSVIADNDGDRGGRSPVPPSSMMGSVTTGLASHVPGAESRHERILITGPLGFAARQRCVPGKCWSPAPGSAPAVMRDLA